MTQNLIALCILVRRMYSVTKVWGWCPAPFGCGCSGIDPKHAFPERCYHANFVPSTSNGVGISSGLPKNYCKRRVPSPTDRGISGPTRNTPLPHQIWPLLVKRYEHRRSCSEQWAAQGIVTITHWFNDLQVIHSTVSEQKDKLGRISQIYLSTPRVFNVPDERLLLEFGSVGWHWQLSYRCSGVWGGAPAEIVILKNTQFDI